MMSRREMGLLAVKVAREWIGTPYHHQMAVKGAGCDCLGLVRGVYTELYGRAPEEPPPYSRDWAEATGRETLIEAAERHLQRAQLPPSFREAHLWIEPGDVLIFRMRRGAMAKHAGIAATSYSMVHAFEHNPVSETPLSVWWLKRLAAIFRFPPVIENSN